MHGRTPAPHAWEGQGEAKERSKHKDNRRRLEHKHGGDKRRTIKDVRQSECTNGIHNTIVKVALLEALR